MQRPVYQVRLGGLGRATHVEIKVHPTGCNAVCKSQALTSSSALLTTLQVGYLVAVGGHSREFVPESFQFAFAQGDTIFYKNELMLQLDAELGDLNADIADCQARFVRDLEDYLLDEEVSVAHCRYTTSSMY